MRLYTETPQKKRDDSASIPLATCHHTQQAMPVTVLSRPLDVHTGDRERVLAKIKDLVVDWLDQLAGGDLPRFEVQ